jgi:hypothetical protein
LARGPQACALPTLQRKHAHLSRGRGRASRALGERRWHQLREAVGDAAQLAEHGVAAPAAVGLREARVLVRVREAGRRGRRGRGVVAEAQEAQVEASGRHGCWLFWCACVRARRWWAVGRAGAGRQQAASRGRRAIKYTGCGSG